MPWRKTAADRARDATVYGSPVYRRNRDAARRRAGGVCEQCHHRHPRLQCDHMNHTGHGSPDHSLGNLRMLCAGEGSCKCHERKTATEGGGFRRVGRSSDPGPEQRTRW
jgi:hypothetical protein